MHSVTVSASSSSENNFMKYLLESIARVKTQNARVYETSVYIHQLDRHYVFATTSKDAHLFIGALGWYVQHDLADVLNDEFMNEEYTEYVHSKLMLSFEDEGKSKRFLVTVAEEKDWDDKLVKVFTLSPAH